MSKKVSMKYNRSDYMHQIIKNITLWLIIRLNKSNKKNKPKNLIVYSGDLIGREIVVNGLFEAKELEILMKWLEEKKFDKGTVLDIGANIGNHSIFFSNYFEKVFSYEPHPMTFKILELNATKKENISCFNFGLSDTETSATIFVSGDHYGLARLFAKENSGFVAEKQQVQIKMLDTHEALKNEKIGLIKIDVEGHEIFALKGAKKLIEREKPVIVFEQHQGEFKNGSTAVIELLKSMDYNSFALIQETPALPTWVPDSFGRTLNNLIRVTKLFVGYEVRIEEVNNIKPGFYSLIVAIPDERKD